MFKIRAVQTPEEQKLFLEACKSFPKTGFFTYAMLECENEKLMGISQFEILGDEGYISDLKSVPELDDFEAMFILGRATMNFIDMCGAHKCRADADAAGANPRLLRAIGFKEDNGEYFADMTGMFDGHCDGHTKELDKIK